MTSNKPDKKQLNDLAKQIEYDQDTDSPAEKRLKVDLNFKVPADFRDRTDIRWQEILPRTKLQPHTRHLFDEQLAARGPFTHVRLNIYPDGGVSRLRLFGAITREGGLGRRLFRLDTLLREEAEAELLACCGSRAWASGT